MNVLVVTCSPRVGGNSDMLAESFIEGAKSAGHEVRRIDAGRSKIAPCRACEYCFAHEGQCCQQDDMQGYYDDLRWADVLVYATPMYYYSFPAQTKLFMDRMFCGVVKPFGISKTALLVCFEDKDKSTVDGLLECFRISANYCKQEIVGEVVVNNVYEKGAIAGNPGLEEARKLGEQLS
ncbi:MAG: flavodoxin family protein [Coriobacteriales bacterium]